MNPLLLGVALCLVSTSLASVEEPPNPGVYVQVSDQWTSIRPIRSTGTTEHLARVVVHGRPPQVVRVFRNPHAPVKIFSNAVKLFIRDIPSFDERDVLIVKFDVRKDHRVLQAPSSGNLSTFKSGFSKKRAPDFETYRISDHTYSIVPRDRLRPGEYMITISPGMRGYDFTVQ